MSAETFEINIIDKLLADIIKEECIYNPTITKSKNTIKGVGYSGDIISIEIKGEDKDNNQKCLHLVAKKAQSSDALRSRIPIELLYKREIHLYSTIFPTYYAMERERGLQMTSFTPKLYKTSTAAKNEVLIFANMKQGGYQLHERQIPMDEDHVRLVMTEYGRFHALTFALRDQQPEIFSTVQRSIDNHFKKIMEDINYVDSIVQKCEKAKTYLGVDDEAVVRTFEAFIQSIPLIFEGLLECMDEYSVILHGDCWNNNMLFHYKDVTNKSKPTKVCFIDFQLSRFGSPVLDLSYFFYACSSKHVIENHNYYLQLYYESLSSHLRKLGSDPEKLYPYTVFEDHWNRYVKYGLLIAMLVIHIMLTETDEAVDISENIESKKNFIDVFDYDIAHKDKYIERVRDIVLHFIRNKYI